MPEILTASWVVPVASAPLRHGAVAVEKGRIAWVGPLSRRPAGAVHDLGSGVLLPGLVNAHCHLELSWMAGRVAAADGFVPWVQGVVAARAYEDPAAVRASVAEALRALEATGTVAVGDVSNTLAHLDLLASSPVAAVVFLELLGWDPGQAPRILDWARRSLPPDGAHGDGVRVRLAAHAPHSVAAALMRALVEEGGPASIHLAESEAETRFLADGGGDWPAFLQDRGLKVPFEPPAESPVRYLDRLGALRPGLVAAHCVRVDGADRALLANRRVHAVLCPRSNLALGVGLAPLPDLMAAGVALALGTDSLASAPSLDLLQDAAVLRRAFPEVPPAVLVRMATQGGAEALGMSDLGALAPGRRAALAFAAAAEPVPDPLEFLVSGAARAVTVRP